VLDVKFGSGAFMKTKAAAKQLADAMAAVGREVKVDVSYLLNPMEEPLGRSVGNALEVAEAVDTLQGRGPADLVRLVVDLAEKVSKTSRKKLETRLKDGSAWKKFVSLVYAQDGDATALEDMLEIHPARMVEPMPAKKDGVIKKVDAELIGRASVLLGGGRQTADDQIDFAVGFSKLKKIGEKVEKGEPVLFIHAQNEPQLRVARSLAEKAVAIR
jgi:thymidine phosphorylase